MRDEERIIICASNNVIVQLNPPNHVGAEGLTLSWQAVTACYEKFVATDVFQHLRQSMKSKRLHFLTESNGTGLWVCHIGIIELPIQIWHKKRRAF